MKGWRIWVMTLMKVLGVLVNPKGMTNLGIQCKIIFLNLGTPPFLKKCSAELVTVSLLWIIIPTTLKETACKAISSADKFEIANVTPFMCFALRGSHKSICWLRESVGPNLIHPHSSHFCSIKISSHFPVTHTFLGLLSWKLHGQLSIVLRFFLFWVAIIQQKVHCHFVVGFVRASYKQVSLSIVCPGLITIRSSPRILHLQM